MKEPFEDEITYRYGNTFSVLNRIGITENDFAGRHRDPIQELDLELYNMKLQLNQVTGEISGAYRTMPKKRKETYNYLQHLLSIAESELENKDLQFYDLRFEIFETIKINVAEVYQRENFIQSEKELTLNQQILILKYTGVLAHLETKIPNQIDRAKLLGTLLDKSTINVKKALSAINGKVVKGEGVNTPNNLKSVKKIFEGLGLSDFSKDIPS